jgi:hypothetical protein
MMLPCALLRSQMGTEIDTGVPFTSFLVSSQSALTYSILIEGISNAIPFSPYRSTSHLDTITALLPHMQKTPIFHLNWKHGRLKRI